jgi:hypothetical protein
MKARSRRKMAGRSGGARNGLARFLRERINQAKEVWREGRFPKVPGDDKEFIPIPEVPKTVSYP